MLTGTLRAARCLLVGVLLAGACTSEPAPDDSETHFLGHCTGRCGGGLECVCGVCTRPCSAADDCKALAQGSVCDASCGAEAGASAACDVACATDDDCSVLGASYACTSGRCRESSHAAVSDAGSSEAESIDSEGGGGAGSRDANGDTDVQSETGTVRSDASVEGGREAGRPDASAPSRCQAEPDLTPALRAPTDLDPDVIARAAAVFGSCAPDDGVSRNVSYMWRATLHTPSFYFRAVEQAECLAGAKCGCDALARCLGYTVRLGVASCESGCDGDVITACGREYGLAEGAALTLDCGKFGESCNVDHICVEGPAVACNVTDSPSCSAEGRPQSCDRGVLRNGPKCSDLGLSCKDGACVGTGATCGGGYPRPLLAFDGISCTGGQLTACVNGGTTTVSCASLGPGFTCQTVDGKAFCGLASECMPADVSYSSATDPLACSGTVLTLCSAGRLEHVDCAELGFTGCEIDTSVGHYGCVPNAVARP